MAEQVEGPWTLHLPGVIPLACAPALHSHIASPDVHIDPHRQELIMFLHGPVHNGADRQMTLLARSRDGLSWQVEDQKLGRSYFRAFPYKSWWYAIANVGDAYRSQHISEPWEKRASPLIGPVQVDDTFGSRKHVDLRHSAWLIDGHEAYLFYTRKQDAPERILCAKIELTDEWENWNISAPVEVLRPERDWEGIHYPLQPSKPGPATQRQELRDPAIYREGEKIYLIYSFGGEEGLALAELKITGVNA
ncbi:hypothetical protein P0Y35_00325 [Kiritimatiellaeota bacterium B1221]|nr:hypothetical protein [Kiritimatiellaeota bacterium B1221]